MNTYDPADLQKKPKKEKNKKTRNYGFIMFLLVLVFLLGVCIYENPDFKKISASGANQKATAYVGVLEVHGTMSGDGSDPAYNQKWLLNQIDEMMQDSSNKGLVLSIDTPGGSVYTVDELYLKIKEYQDTTLRPVYAYMESMAASGGYYVAAPADKIYANRNCWTGSIGVTIGTIYDVSEFLEDLGIRTVTITAGENKAMGSAVEPLTDEQKSIYQGLVDEAYSQFVAVVAEGRNMKLKRAEGLADGRIYTAKQAKANGLIDEIGTREEALQAMMKENELKECEYRVMTYEPAFSFSNWMFGLTEKIQQSAESEYDQILRLMEENQTFTISYLANERK
ncbi:MAG: signal peptide peptidase SppA [Firmicutes bacterium]|nr:signal peptide peptidase SppA [Bacillota bacterium]